MARREFRFVFPHWSPLVYRGRAARPEPSGQTSRSHDWPRGPPGPSALAMAVASNLGSCWPCVDLTAGVRVRNEIHATTFASTYLRISRTRCPVGTRARSPDKSDCGSGDQHRGVVDI